MMRSTAPATCSRMARTGRSMPAMSTIVSRRESESRGLLAWTVVIEPSWPVFIAWSMSRAAPSRTSPTTMRSGRMRRQLRTRSRMVTWPEPSMLAGRDSMPQDVLLVQLELGGVLDRHDALVAPGGSDDMTLRVVVLPEPVPPRDDDVAPAAHAGLEEVAHRRGERPEGDEVLVGERVRGELADREDGAVERDRRDDGVDARAVGQARVDERAGLVDPAADAADDLVDDAAEVGLVGELRVDG